MVYPGLFAFTVILSVHYASCNPYIPVVDFLVLLGIRCLVGIYFAGSFTALRTIFTAHAKFYTSFQVQMTKPVA